MAEERCILCESYFRSGALEKGKCRSCTKLYPKAKSREELLKQTNPNKAQTLTDTVVQQMIYDTLEEAGLERHECEKCKKLYFRTSPAQKQCRKCKVKETK